MKPFYLNLLVSTSVLLAGCDAFGLVPNREPSIADRESLSTVTPSTAKARAIKASKREAAEVCAEIEADLSKRFNGDSFTTTFISHHPYTAHYVERHFAPSWFVLWNEHNREWNEWTITLTPSVRPWPVRKPAVYPYTTPFRPL